MRSKVWLAASVLLAHADVTKNIKYFSMGPKLRHLTVDNTCKHHRRAPHTGTQCMKALRSSSENQRMCMHSKAWLAASVSLRLARLPPLRAECDACGCARHSNACLGHKTVKLTIYSDAMSYSGENLTEAYQRGQRLASET